MEKRDPKSGPFLNLLSFDSRALEFGIYDFSLRVRTVGLTGNAYHQL